MLDTLKVQRDFILDPSLMLYLPLYKLDGKKFMFQDAYGRLCTAVGATWQPNGRDFDGGTNRVALGLCPAPPANGTVMAWIEPDAVDGIRAIYCVGNVYAALRITAAEKGELFLYDGTGYSATSTASIVADTWTHITGTWGSAGMKLYLNAGEDGTDANTGTHTGTGESESIGYNHTGSKEPFDGLMGEFWFYNRALTILEIQHHYLASKGRYR